MNRPISTTIQPARLLGALVLAGVLAACSSGDGKATPAAKSSPSPAPPARAAAASPTVDANATPFSPAIASSELVVGPSRFTLGILDNKTRQPVPDAKVHYRFFTLQGNQGTLRFEADPVFVAPARDAGIERVVNHRHPDGTNHPHANVETDVGVYAAQVQFDQAGMWGVEITFTTKDGRQGKVNAGFEVKAQSPTPAIGTPAPRTRNLTARDVKDLSEIDSAAEPDPALHQTTVADAIAAGRPALVGFITPGYCTSQFCGPVYELVRKLLPKYGDKAALVQIEPYKDPVKQVLSDAAAEWKLQSEPYIFIVDRSGKVAAKFEGPVGLAELDAAMAKVTS